MLPCHYAVLLPTCCLPAEKRASSNAALTRRRLPHVRTMVHHVFDGRDTREGDVFARISHCVPGDSAVVGHIVKPIDDPEHGATLREELNIPMDATVFGRYGAYETFDIDFVREAVVEVADLHPSIFFVFLHTPPFAHPPRRNIRHLPRTSDRDRKAAFIRTCDAMLHARCGGETFGLSIAEFASANRPVLTSSAHIGDVDGIARCHLDMLTAHGEHCSNLFYHDKSSLTHLLTSFKRGDRTTHDWNAYHSCAPSAVMATFKATFLDAAPPSGKPHPGSKGESPRAALQERKVPAPPVLDETMRAALQKMSLVDRKLAALRALPTAPPRVFPRPKPYVNCFKGAYIVVRLAPSVSAGAAQQLLPRAVFTAVGEQGGWIQLGSDRWVLVAHPVYGTLVAPLDEQGASGDSADAAVDLS